MHSDLVELGWTEDHWNRITSVVTEEAQKARVAAQGLPLSGPEDGNTVAIPPFDLFPQLNRPAPPPLQRLAVNSNPILPITTLAINVQLRSHEVADDTLNAALGMFRRAANYIARLEDALVFNGRMGPNIAPVGTGSVPPVFTVSGDGATPGVFWPPPPAVQLPRA